jgi:RND family efflux transporter MFP subunit
MNKATVLLIAGVIAPLIGPTAVAKPLPQPLACLIVPDKVADLGSPVIGVIDAVYVDRGDVVKKGQIVARLASDVEDANERVMRSRARAEGDLRAAVSNEGLSKQQLARGQQLLKDKYISAQELDKLRSDYVIAEQKVAEAREQLRTASHELELSRAQVDQRIIRSPFDGVVVERYANPGERIEDKPLLKVASVDPLRVEVVAPIDMFGKVKDGQSATVYAELPGAVPRIAHVTQIDSVLDPASNTFRLRLAMNNSDGSVPAGLRCRIDLALQDDGSEGNPLGMKLESSLDRTSVRIKSDAVAATSH